MYSKEFIEAVKRCYPNSKTIIDLAEKGDYFLGRYLDDSRSGSVSVSYILSHSPEEVRQEALKEKERSDLYSQWVSGECYSDGQGRQTYCPANWLQNSDNPRRYEFTEQICKGARYVSYYPACERYGCKQECWAKYDVLAKGK